MPYFYVNGDIVPSEKAVISVNDRSYQFGEGVFETFRTWQGKLLFLDRHLARLEWSLAALGILFPTDLDLKKIAQDLLEKNAFKEARFKLVLSRKVVSELDEAKSNDLNIVVLVEPFDEASYPIEYRLKTVRSLIDDTNPLVALKTTNYLTKIYARAAAKEQSYDDAILLNSAGRVTEATTGNPFWVDPQGRLFTIPEEEGRLGGVMQKVLLDLMKEKKLAISTARITPEELSSAREVFLTNAVVGIKPVVAIDLRRLSGGEPGSVTLSLRDMLLNHIKKECENE